MNDLDTLRPEVREALACMDSCATVKPSSGDGFLDETWLTIRAELLRLARENAELRRAWDDALLTGTGILKVERVDPATVMLPVAPRQGKGTPVPQSEHEALTERAEKAEAELAAALKANRDCVDHFEQMQAELAAMKARILPGAAKVEIADTDDSDGNPYGWVGGTLLSHNLIGKRVRLLVVEE